VLWRSRTNEPIMVYDSHQITVTVNGTSFSRLVESRVLLSDFLRHDLLLAGTHVGCEHGVCGACTVIMDGVAVRSCLMFAAQANGHSITTIEGLAPGPNSLHPLQESMRECHGLQCGYCTPGILMTMKAFLDETPQPDEVQIRESLSGNLCRCTGYQPIVEAVQMAAKRLRS
jgi:aerobic-type carbon monoxide dehydrogenase small subunit (CoxS/CutS family)